MECKRRHRSPRHLLPFLHVQLNSARPWFVILRQLNQLDPSSIPNPKMCGPHELVGIEKWNFDGKEENFIERETGKHRAIQSAGIVVKN